MATTTKQSNQVYEAMTWFYGKRECRSTEFVDDTAGSLSAFYFDLNVIDGDNEYAEKQYYVWMDNGSSTDPAVAGKTGIPVVYTDGDTKEAIAALYVTALASVEVLAVDNGAGVVQVENGFLSEVTVEDYTNAATFVLAVLQLGSGGELGAVVSGGASFTTEQNLGEITRDDQGSIIQDLISLGASYSIEMSLAEMTTENWKRLIGQVFGDFDGENVGFGTSKVYQSAFSFSGQLCGHPKRLAFSDRSNDVCIWKSPANMSDLSFSGQEVQAASFAFQALPDTNKPEKFNIFYRGDHSLL